LVGANLLALVWLACVVLTPERRGVHDLVAGTRVVLASGRRSTSRPILRWAREGIRPRAV
jgi:uncharacterized RDD family membrane protein YckC